MQTNLIGRLGALAAAAILLFPVQAQAQGTQATASSHAHDHASSEVYKGMFEDSQIEARTLRDWRGDWQSVYPYLVDGTLDPVMADKAAHGDKTAEQYRAYYTTGYQTAVDRIIIIADTVTFHEDGKSVHGTYEGDGYEVLTYKAGNRGVRYIFTKKGGDEAAPQFIQFSDHRIAPAISDHFHLYWGDDRAELLEEVTNWPTYYPAGLSGEEIVKEMLAH